MKKADETVEPRKGWFEEYRCGCVSEVVKRKRDLLGYCGKHGEDRRHVHRIHPNLVKEKLEEARQKRRAFDEQHGNG